MNGPRDPINSVFSLTTITAALFGNIYFVSFVFGCIYDAPMNKILWIVGNCGVVNNVLENWAEKKM